MWFRVPQRLPDDGHLHEALLGFATDWTGTGARPLHLEPDIRGIVSIDHAVWFHHVAGRRRRMAVLRGVLAGRRGDSACSAAPCATSTAASSFPSTQELRLTRLENLRVSYEAVVDALGQQHEEVAGLLAERTPDDWAAPRRAARDGTSRMSSFTSRRPMATRSPASAVSSERPRCSRARPMSTRGAATIVRTNGRERRRHKSEVGRDRGRASRTPARLRPAPARALGHRDAFYALAGVDAPRRMLDSHGRRRRTRSASRSRRPNGCGISRDSLGAHCPMRSGTRRPGAPRPGCVRAALAGR